jgi:hypothetical protein
MQYEGQRRHSKTAEKDANRMMLWKVLENTEYEECKMVYVYDFGDNWEHYFEVKGREQATNRFRVVSGEGHGVAEDVGSWTGWNKLKEAYRTATREKVDISACRRGVHPP